MAMQTNLTIWQIIKEGFVKGLLSPLLSVYVAKRSADPSFPKVELGSFAKDLGKIGSDFDRAIGKYKK